MGRDAVHVLNDLASGREAEMLSQSPMVQQQMRSKLAPKHL